MEKMALDLGMVTKTKEGLEKGKQARLSQYENNPNGMSLELVIKYAEYFGLKEGKKFTFIHEALKSSKKIIIDDNIFKGESWENFILTVASILSPNSYVPGKTVEPIDEEEPDIESIEEEESDPEPLIDLLKEIGDKMRDEKKASPEMDHTLQRRKVAVIKKTGTK